MSTDKQLLEKYQKERTALEGQQDALAARLTALDSIITGLRSLTGETVPTPRRSSSGATGTKALILDVLADGTRCSSRAIAAELKVKPTGSFTTHLSELAAAGDIDRQGKSRATTYGIPSGRRAR